MGKVLITILVIIILGLYFFTEPTKGLLKITGKATWTAAKGIVKAVGNSNEYKEIKQEVKNITQEQISKIERNVK